MSAERRLDDAVAALGRARPQLDEITRARIGARVEAELARDATRTRTVAPSRPWPLVALAVGGGLAVAVVALVWRVAAQRPDAGALLAADVAAPPPLTRPIDVAAGESRQVALGEATITVFGPGRLEGTGDRATADAAAVVIDRPRGDEPMILAYAGVEVIVTRATFALDRGHGVRVTVMRGELTLRCVDQPRLVRAGESAACADAAATIGAPATAASVATAPASSAPPTAAPPSAPRPPTRVAKAGPAMPASTTTELPAPAAADAAAPLAPTLEPVPTPPPEPAAAPDPEPIATSAAPDLDPLAEGAMRRGDEAGARAALEAVIASAPASLDAAVALLDLARLAHQRRDAPAARAYLARLAVHPRRAAIAAPADRLRAELSRH